MPWRKDHDITEPTFQSLPMDRDYANQYVPLPEETVPLPEHYPLDLRIWDALAQSTGDPTSRRTRPNTPPFTRRAPRVEFWDQDEKQIGKLTCIEAYVMPEGPYKELSCLGPTRVGYIEDIHINDYEKVRNWLLNEYEEQDFITLTYDELPEYALQLLHQYIQRISVAL